MRVVLLVPFCVLGGFMRRSFARFLVVLTFAITAAMGSLAEAPKDDARLKHGFRRPQQNGMDIRASARHAVGDRFSAWLFACR